MRANYGIAMFSGVATACVLAAGIAAGWLYLENQKLKSQVEYLQRERAETQAALKQIEQQGREVSQVNTCLNHLRMLDGAVQQWALEHRKRGTDVPSRLDLVEYLPGGFPQCPAGRTYSWQEVAGQPRCSVPNHTLD